MDQMIETADFMHTEDDQLWHDFNEKLEKFRRSSEAEKVTVVSIKSALKALQNKICQPQFPPEATSGYWMGHHTLKTVMGMISDLIDEHKAKPSDFQPLYLEFFLGMMQAGPTSSHIEYIMILRSDSSVEYQEYFQSLQGGDLDRVIFSLKRDYPRADPALEWSLYCSRHLDKLPRIILDDFSDEQRREAHRSFIDLFMFFHTNFMDSDLQYRKQMYSIACQIELKFERDVFKGIQDVAVLKKYFPIISSIILSPQFPQAQDIGDSIKGILSDMLKLVSEADILTEMYGEIMDLAQNITVQKAGCEETKPHFETIGYFFFHVKETGVKNNENLYDGLVRKFISVLDNIQDESYLLMRFAEPIMYNCLNKAMGVSDDQVAQWIKMIKALLKHPVAPCIEAAYRAMREKEKLLKWKNYPADVVDVFDLVGKLRFPEWMKEEDLKKGFTQLEALLGHFLDEVKKARLVQDLSTTMTHFVFHCMEKRTLQFYSVGNAVARKLEINPKKDKALVMEIVQWLTTALGDKTYGWEKEDWKLSGTAQDLISKAFANVKDGKLFTWEDYDALIGLLKLCQDSLDFLDIDAYMTMYYRIFSSNAYSVVNWLQTMNEIKRVSPLVPGILDMVDSDVKEVQQTGTQLLFILSQSSDLMASHVERLICRFLEIEDENVLWAVSNSYEHNPGPLAKYFSDLFQYVDSGNSSLHQYMLLLLQKVAKYQPDLFTEENIAVLFKKARGDNTHIQTTLLLTLDEIAKRRTEKAVPHMEEVMVHPKWQEHNWYYVCRILQYCGLHSEENAEKVVSFMIKLAQTASEKTTIQAALAAARLIGYKYRSSIEKHRGAVTKIRDEIADDNSRDMCSSILDMLDGKSVEKVAEELKALQEDVADLQIRVDTTEGEVAEVKDTVQRQGHDLDNVKNEVAEQGQRLDLVEETVEETVLKVEEIDGKTLSHAPFWSRDVSKLLNPEAEHDWRLLARRLGYKNDDIRGWAQQADPCMAMLNEWYATHKTREATHAILNALQDTGREDAAIIVENAMKNAEAVVEDEEFDYASPPDIFISYQWGHQDHVRLLRQHLEMAGYSCWMDVGQMGGGDKLFEKIDSGIRGAKVVVSCVTEKYAKSPNCNREVNLAVSLGKPIIPLLMEKTTWPPPGSMGPIFSEYLFVRFFTRDGEDTNDQRYWPTDKFQELLMQLSVNGLAPDQSGVQPEYKDWWIPKIKEVVVDKNRSKSQGQSSSSAAAPASDEKASTSPDIFISYQWGRQLQIIQLYQRLTSLGYTCWLDIMQMGGGDSLYDKIDRGLRGCRVVVSCVTPKYSVSANCRREVSLADALHKPLIPILLESGPWPPPGPMGPILTQLLYIDCSDMNEDWTGPKFDELIAKIDQYMPNVTLASVTGRAATGKGAAVASSVVVAEDDGLAKKSPKPEDSKEKGRSLATAEESKDAAAVKTKGAGDGLSRSKTRTPSASTSNVSQEEETATHPSTKEKRGVESMKEKGKSESTNENQDTSASETTERPRKERQREMSARGNTSNETANSDRSRAASKNHTADSGHESDIAAEASKPGNRSQKMGSKGRPASDTESMLSILSNSHEIGWTAEQEQRKAMSVRSSCCVIS